MEYQVYACNVQGDLVHASPYHFVDSLPMGDQCRRFELMWRRWRDTRNANGNPRQYPKKYKHVPEYHACYDDRLNASVYHVVNLDTGKKVGEFSLI